MVPWAAVAVVVTARPAASDVVTLPLKLVPMAPLTVPGVAVKASVTTT